MGDPRTAASDRAVDDARVMLAEHAAERARRAQERAEREAEARAYAEYCEGLRSDQGASTGHSHHRRGRMR